MSTPEEGRKHLSPDILKIIDNLFPYEKMEIGQTLTISAIDAKTNKNKRFDLVIVSVRPKKEDPNRKTATFIYHGDFSFYDGETRRPVEIPDGTYMENGISATFIPETNMTLSYYGGIGIGRDHSFSYVDKYPNSVIAHGISGIQVKDKAEDFVEPDISAYRLRMVETKRAKEEAYKAAVHDFEARIFRSLNERFKNDPRRTELEGYLRDFSPNGKVALLTFFMYAQEDGVSNQAWMAFRRSFEDHFCYEHPSIRGDIEIKASTRAEFDRMYRGAGIKWPRSVKIEGSITESRRTQLAKKLEEYFQRINDHQRSERSRNDARIKHAVLETLLKTGKIDPSELRKVLAKESWFDEERFQNAVAVIEDYVQTGGANIGGGTGLH